MGKRKKAALLVGLLLGLSVLGFWICERFSEPYYDGHPLSYWVRSYRSNPPGASDPVARARADEAVRHIGTNAIPFLIEWIKGEGSRRERALAAIHRRLPGRLAAMSIPRKFMTVRTDERRMLGSFAALRALGPEARSAAAPLAQMMTLGKQLRSVSAAHLIASLGDDGAAAFERVVGDVNTPNRAKAIERLGYKPPTAPAFLRVLNGFVNDPDEDVRQAALKVLDRIANPRGNSFSRSSPLPAAPSPAPQ